MKYFKWKTPESPQQYPVRFRLRRYVDITHLTIWSVTILSLLISFFYAFNFTPRYQAVVLMETRVIGSLNGILSTTSNPVINAALGSGLSQTTTSSFDRTNSMLQTSMNKMALPGDINATMGNWLREMALIKTTPTIDDTIQNLALDVQKKPFTVPLFTSLNNWFWSIFGMNFIHFKKINGLKINSYVFPKSLDGETFLLKRTGQANQYQLILPGMKPVVGVLQTDTVFSYAEQMGSINLKDMSVKKVRLIKYKIGDVEEQINQNLTVKPLDEGGLSNVIQVIYEDSDPIEAAKIANAVAISAIKLSKQREGEYALEAKNNLLLQKKIVLARLKKEDAVIDRFLLKTASADPAYESRVLIDQLADIDKEIRTTEQQKILLLSTNMQDNFHIKDLDNVIDNLHSKKYKIIRKITERNVFDQNYSEMIRNYQNDLLLNQVLVQQIQRLNLILANPIGDIRIILSASPPHQNVSYSRTLIILLGLIAGLIIGYILALAIE